ncbi:MAG: hypothetical protein JXB39_09665 [Deltaproteobacteria bacterium]|nr:hypothetical protein [Deltaproteobacteria bacterium]
MPSTCSPILLAAILWGGACSRDPARAQTDRETYVALLRSSDTPIAERMDRCLELADPALRSDCALVTAEAAPRQGAGRIEAWCDRVPAGTWRDECWFQASEQARRAGDWMRALALCRETGPFSTDCRQHLWQLALHASVPPEGPAGFATHLETAREVFERFRPLLAEDPEFEERFWLRWFQEGFEQGLGLDVSACDPLPVRDAARCRLAATHVYRTRLDRSLLTSAPSLAGFCDRATKDPTVAGVLGFEFGLVEGNPGSIATPSPVLDEVVVQEYRRLCDAPTPTGRARPP